VIAFRRGTKYSIKGTPRHRCDFVVIIKCGLDKKILVLPGVGGCHCPGRTRDSSGALLARGEKGGMISKLQDAKVVVEDRGLMTWQCICERNVEWENFTSDATHKKTVLGVILLLIV
jgi:hypothetical protein